MDDHIDWLKHKRDVARSMFEQYSSELEQVSKCVDGARKALQVWSDALAKAMEDEGLVVEQEREAEGVKKLKRREPSIPDLAEEVLRERGPLSSQELQHALDGKGKKVDLATLSASLNRHKPLRFDRDTGRRWFVAAREKSGLAGQ